MGKEKIEQLSTSDKIALFLQKNRIAFLVLVGIIAAGIIGSVAFFSVRGFLEKKAIAAVEKLEQRKNELGTISESSNSAEIETLLNEINTFAGSTFGYAAARGFSLAADIYFSKNEWSKAEESWVLSAKKAPGIYLAPISLFNAAVAAEEMGKLDRAIDYYNESLSFPGVFPAAAHARFNIGRIYEEKNNKTEAANAYREVIEKDSGSNWAKLAQSRIISIENK